MSVIEKENNISSGKKKLSAMKMRDMFGGYMLVAPFMLLLAVFSFYVFVSGFKLSLTDAQGINEGSYIGLQNYKDVLYENAFKSKDFWLAVKTTFLYTIGCLVTQVPVAFVLAFILNHIPVVRIRGLLRAAFFVPVLINTVVIALLFRMFFNRDQGLINYIFGVFGLPNQTDWLFNSSWAIPLIIIVSFWQWTGFHMVYFLAQLQTIDPSMYEAAKIDGASPAKVLIRITMPLMRPAITYVMVTSAIGGLMMFDLVFMLFPNASYGPGGVAKTLVAFIYDEAFSQQFLMGRGAAIGWITFVIIMLVSLVQLRVLGLGKHDEA